MMKSNPPLPNLAKQDFIAQRFHPRSGFIPTQADLVEKDSELYPILSLFLVQMKGLRNPFCASVSSDSIITARKSAIRNAN